MIEFIPIRKFYDVYIYVCLLLVIGTLVHGYAVKLNDERNLKFLRTSGFWFLILLTLFIGLRPISGYVFGDMGTYSRYFERYAQGLPIITEKDVLFHYYMKGLSYFVSVHVFFLITDVLYIFPLYFVSKKHFKEYWFYAFLMFVVSLSFFSYGTNGIRNGVATSFFIWGLCYPKKKFIMAILFLIAVLFHKTLLLPIMAYVLTFVYNKPKTFLIAWLSAIPLSLVAGSIFITIFTSLGFGDDRLESYLTGEYTESVLKTGFRWDFLFYSSFPVFAGWYFIFKKNFQDPFYYQIFNTYLLCNTFWILVIRANFSNRFAYLSWFIMGIVIIYPVLKQYLFKNQQIMIVKIITAYFLFTFIMYLVY